MNLVELTQLIEAINDRLFRRWQFFIAVVLALSGWLVSGGDLVEKKLSLALTAALVAFFWGNGMAIHKNVKGIVVVENERRRLLTDEATEMSGCEPDFTRYLMESSAVYPQMWILGYALMCIYAITLLHLRTGWPCNLG